VQTCVGLIGKRDAHYGDAAIKISPPLRDGCWYNHRPAIAAIAFDKCAFGGVELAFKKSNLIGIYAVAMNENQRASTTNDANSCRNNPCT
jgi:hypothetical protein